MKVWVVGRGIPSRHNQMMGSFELEQAQILARRGCDVRYIAVSMTSLKNWRHAGYRHLEKNGLKVDAFGFPLGRFFPHTTVNALFERSFRHIADCCGRRASGCGACALPFSPPLRRVRGASAARREDCCHRTLDPGSGQVFEVLQSVQSEEFCREERRFYLRQRRAGPGCPGTDGLGAEHSYHTQCGESPFSERCRGARGLSVYRLRPPGSGQAD